jgi:glyoxylase-like metal-dependent hydrolase (beta-lactamase superfamily II)
MEVVPGIYRIESDLGPRFMCQYFLGGSDRRVLVDTGIAATPRDVIAPYLEERGFTIGNIDVVLTSHADLDHCGGNRVFRELNSRAVLVCGERDRRWIESNAAMYAENYSWHQSYGFPGFDEATRAAILGDLGGDCPVDVGLSGGETLRLSRDWLVEIIPLPGHSPGHLGVWDARSGALVMIDAVLYDGIYDRAGNRLIPPRYYDADAYEQTIRRIRRLRPDVLLCAHFDVLEGARALEWLDDSMEFTRSLDRAVREGLASGITDLWELTQRVDKLLGPYPEFMVELGAPVRAHARRIGAPID